MRAAILYTVVSLVNLIAFAVGILFLPAQVPIHFNAALTADAMGSPWVYLSLPGAAALISAGIWAALFQKKNRAVTVGVLTAAGIVFATIGWTFFALVSGGVGSGERATFPIALVIVLPISLLLAWLGALLPRLEPGGIIGIRTRSTLASGKVRKRTYRLGGALLFAAGCLSAAAAVLFGCLPVLHGVQFIPFICLAASVAAAAAASLLFASALARHSAEKEDKEAQKGTE